MDSYVITLSPHCAAWAGEWSISTCASAVTSLVCRLALQQMLNGLDMFLTQRRCLRFFVYGYCISVDACQWFQASFWLIYRVLASIFASPCVLQQCNWSELNSFFNNQCNPMLGVTVWGCLSARCPWVLTENRRKTEGTEKGSEHGSCRGYGSGEKETSGPPSWWGLGLDDCGRLLLGHCLHTCRHQVSLAGREGHGVPLAWSWHNSELWSDKPVCLFYSISGRPIKSDYYLFFFTCLSTVKFVGQIMISNKTQQ